MISTLAALAMAVPGCPNATAEQAANTVMISFEKNDFSCIRSIIMNPYLKFQGNLLHQSVIDSLNFRAKGNRSYIDIIKNGVTIDIYGSPEKKSAFYVISK